MLQKKKKVNSHLFIVIHTLPLVLLVRYNFPNSSKKLFWFKSTICLQLAVVQRLTTVTRATSRVLGKAASFDLSENAGDTEQTFAK